MEKPDRSPFDTVMKQLDFLKDSPLYQEIIEEGRQQGIEQGIEQGKGRDILLFVELRFPSLLPQAKQVIERGMALEQLETLMRKLYLATTIEEAGAALQEA